MKAMNIYLFLFVIITGIVFSSCHQPSRHSAVGSLEKLNAKYKPNENFLLQRTWPDTQISFQAYEKALESAIQQSAEKTDTGFDGDWTTQGPGNLGARVNTLAINPTNENHILLGYSHGGIWRTTDGGNNWAPVFDDKPYLSISSLAFDPSNPDVVWAGTGDENIGGFPFIGDGIYKSEDGGITWEHKGLTLQRIVTQIIVHPDNSDIIWAATMGLPFERNNNRGLYKTIDGGDTWTQVLFLSDQAGICDLVIDPFNPDVLYASGWDRIRNNTESLITGPGAKVFKSTDGGDTWTELSGGLPTDNLCRTGLAISKQNPGTVFAMYVGTNFQLFNIYKSTDAGATWTPIPTDSDANFLGANALGGFGWYFAKLRVNPNNDDDIYLLGVELWRTLDGGQTWFETTPPWFLYEVHADKHDLQFTNSGNIYLGTDGGAYKSIDNGNTWTDIENIATTQFYRVAYNPFDPDYYVGGAQDNGTSGGNASTINSWDRIYGGDGFQAIFHPLISDVFYVETQNGNIVVFDGYDFLPGDDGIDGADRRNWDMQYIMNPQNPNELYTGTYRVYRSTAGIIPFWEPISESLTDTIGPPPDAARFHTITCINQSAINENILYVGTTDANVWRSLDEGATWESIKDGLPVRYVTDIKPSPNFENNVYVSHSGYKDDENIPHIHRSTDNGSTWTDISADLPNLAVNDLYILPNHQDTVLFAATDGGVYGTLDGGVSWNRLGKNMPFIPVYDLEWNEFYNQLVAGTYARSIMTYEIDSLLFQEPIDTTVSTNLVAFETPEIKLFPNPAADFIQLNWYNSENGRPVELAIIAADGQLVRNWQLQISGKIEERINIAQLPAGNYFLKIKTRHRIETATFVKK